MLRLLHLHAVIISELIVLLFIIVWMPTEEHLIQYQTQRKDISFVIDLVIFSQRVQLLRSSINYSTAVNLLLLFGELGRKPKISNLKHLILDQNILRLEVIMLNSGHLERLISIHQIQQDLDIFLKRELLLQSAPTLNQMIEGAIVAVLHHYVEILLGL